MVYIAVKDAPLCRSVLALHPASEYRKESRRKVNTTEAKTSNNGSCTAYLSPRVSRHTSTADVLYRECAGSIGGSLRR